VLKRGQHARDDLYGLVDGGGDIALEDVANRVPLDVLHDDERHGLRNSGGAQHGVLARVVDGDDRGVVETRSCLSLAAEARLEGGVASEVCAQYRDRDGAAKARVIADVSLGHSSATNEVADLIPAREDLRVLAHLLSLRGPSGRVLRTIVAFPALMAVSGARL